MTTRSYPRLDESIQTVTLDNGLHIYCIPRESSAKTFAMLAVNFGSIDCNFTLDGRTYDVTPGIAHFLEHKMFEEKDGNALQKLTALGAQPNAFTSHTMTAYHFTCTSRFAECLEILLRFVTTPYFTEENVAKEKGIIEQEISMLDDRPSWQAYVGVMEGLYAVHPVRISVAGSRQSIAPIDPAILELCHRGFYAPSNLALIVCGQYDFDQVVDLAKRMTPTQSATIASRSYGVEPEQAAASYVEKNMAVSRPLFMLGCKDTVPEQPYRRQLIGELAAACVCGKSTVLYDTLYQKGVLNRTFEPNYFTFSGGACALFSGESDNPQVVREALEDEMRRIASEGLADAVFNRAKKAAYGRYIRQTNDPAEICRMQAEACFSGAQCFDFAEILQQVTTEQVLERIRQWARDGMTTLAVVAPKKEAKA
ncbi:MAG: pitrilysin family protein [Eubacteriales bacterium]|nr:pitrilysin family protein [Eubacteriales bacterium]